MGKRKRCDGNLIPDLPAFRIINPFVMRRRNESAIYFSHQIRIQKTLSFIRRYGKEKTGKGMRITVFHIILCALVRTLALRPQLNRFVSGQRIYQRNRIQISFIVKKRLSEEARETNAKISFNPDETLETILTKVNQAVKEARDEEGSESDKEIEFFTRFPRFVLNLAVKAFLFLDYFGLAPRRMIELDPLFTSIYVANLGSVGLDAPFHHLYEWGNASLFAAIGKLKKEPVVQEDGSLEVEDVLNVNYTLDDRITEGIYCAKAIDLFKHLLENPDELLERPDLSPEIIAELNLLDPPEP